ncbi:MAG: YaaR family protein [Candidatus Omnitrophica bacterium]|nr:YaaR family protein [Candidatus Omnitrophota bacterium]
MRVHRFPLRTVRRKRKISSRTVIKSSSTQSFKDSLQESIKKELRKQLSRMLLDIEEEGKMMVTRRTLDSVLKYKSLVKNFLDLLVKNIYHLSEKVNLNPRGKQNILVAIESIDNSLEDLLKLVLNKEVDNLRILEKVGEIQGLLIDLYS